MFGFLLFELHIIFFSFLHGFEGPMYELLRPDLLLAGFFLVVLHEAGLLLLQGVQGLEVLIESGIQCFTLVSEFLGHVTFILLFF